jgi:magnesium chelatase family protein
MGYAMVYARALCGVRACLIKVEVHILAGLPGFHIVGLPETVVKEARHRVKSALLHAGFKFPNKRLVVNLAPADMPKEGGRFDLAIAIGLLQASEQLLVEAAHQVFCAELGLNGELRSVPGILPVAHACQLDQQTLFIAKEDAKEAALIPGLEWLAADHLLAVVGHLAGRCKLSAKSYQEPQSLAVGPDLSDVKGQPQAKRALEVAACGGHSLLLSGPPGTGKTLLARRLPGILPELTLAEALTSASILSIVKGRLDTRQWRQRPFRAPHHSASSAALVGGGSPPRPGEISLAHYGVLFLDELPEFSRQVLESLREPLEQGEITISRSRYQYTFPASCQLVAAMNPCPCGYLGAKERDCYCRVEQIQRYHQRLSGPLLDRIDLQVVVNAPSLSELLGQTNTSEEKSCDVRARVEACRARQFERQKMLNVRLAQEPLMLALSLSRKDQAWLLQSMEQLKISARKAHKVLRVALTLMDMAEAQCVGREQLAEALSLVRTQLTNLSSG